MSVYVCGGPTEDASGVRVPRRGGGEVGNEGEGLGVGVCGTETGTVFRGDTSSSLSLGTSEANTSSGRSSR